MEKKKLLFVCLGNICRSPLAHYVMLKKIKDEGLSDRFEVDSCGIGAWHQGESSDHRMIKTASRHGISLKHKARQFNPPSDVRNFDHIFAMDLNNYHDIINATEEELKHKVKLFRCYEEGKAGSLEVPDPYFGGESGFEKVFQMVDRNCSLILNKIIGK